VHRVLALITAGVLLLQASCGKFGIDKRDEHGMTALMRAARKGDRAEVERLVSRGANVNAVVPTRDLRELIAFLSWMQQLPESDIGYTPLMYAAQGESPEIVHLLLERGADVQHQARGGRTALDLAVWRSNIPVLQLLISAGARPGPRQLAMAIMHGAAETVSFLLQHGANVDAPVPGRGPAPPGSPPIVMAAQRGDPAMLKLLIDAGANVKAQDRNGWSAMRWARHSGGRMPQHQAEIIRLLAEAGAEDVSGQRAEALFAAVLQADVGGVRQALSSGANPNARDNRGVPALIYACNKGEAEIVRLLIQAGAHVNASPQHDTTPLIAAITGGSVDVVRQLLAAGARVDQADHIHRTPLQVASSWKRTEITRLLLTSSASVDSAALAMAALNGSADQVRLLLSSGADPNAGNGYALHEAARGCYRGDNSEVIRMLLDAGSMPQAKRGEEYTVLHRAAGLCEPEVLRLLLSRGADPNARDMSRSTPLISAAASGKLENVRVLLGAGAQVNARNGDGRSALDHASSYPEVQAELRKAGAR
jgi:ankyrin repeat protein